MNKSQKHFLDFSDVAPKICVPIVGKTDSEIVHCAQELKNSPAQIIEWRGDYYVHLFEEERVKDVLSKIRKIIGNKALLFTIRTAGEGGEVAISYAKYCEILHAIGETGLVDYIDVEVFWGDREYKEDFPEDAPQSIAMEPRYESVRNLVQELQQQNEVEVIGSYHDFEKTPSNREMYLRLMTMKEMGVSIPKMAVMPTKKNDVLRLMEITMEVKEKLQQAPVITMSMGALGKISRVAGALYGSSVTFGCLGKESAPGQISLYRLQQLLEEFA